ncbi:MAG: amidohydrolase family protein, partial [Anaerolineae bacterium]
AAGRERLHPVWVLEPPLKTGRAAAGSLVDAMLAARVRAARLRLRSKGVLSWVWAELLDALEQHQVPCFLDFGPAGSTLGELQDQDVDALRNMASEHPQLPLIVSHVMGGLGVHPALMHLIPRTPNIYLDISGILEYWRTIALTAGPERVLFASGMPFTDPGILVSNVQYDPDLAQADKRLICGDNLRRLLGKVR